MRSVLIGAFMFGLGAVWGWSIRDCPPEIDLGSVEDTARLNRATETLRFQSQVIGDQDRVLRLQAGTIREQSDLIDDLREVCEPGI